MIPKQGADAQASHQKDEQQMAQPSTQTQEVTDNKTDRHIVESDQTDSKESGEDSEDTEFSSFNFWRQSLCPIDEDFLDKLK